MSSRRDKPKSIAQENQIKFIDESVSLHAPSPSPDRGATRTGVLSLEAPVVTAASVNETSGPVAATVSATVSASATASVSVSGSGSVVDATSDSDVLQRLDIDQEKLRLKGFCFERLASEENKQIGLSPLAIRDLLDDRVLPLHVDFLSGAMRHRIRGLAKGQPLARALGLRSLGAADSPFVIDATAGLGSDALTIVAMGCRVRAIERNPVVFALLEDGYRRLVAEANRQDCANSRREREAMQNIRDIAGRLSIEHGSARSVLVGLSEDERPDVVFLDPMYPEQGRSKSALPKKAMQIFRRLIGDDHDVAEVFAAALAVARQRVVVKRPLEAPFLVWPESEFSQSGVLDQSGQRGQGGQSGKSGKSGQSGQIRPSHVFVGKSARYDMYLTKK